MRHTGARPDLRVLLQRDIDQCAHRPWMTHGRHTPDFLARHREDELRIGAADLAAAHPQETGYKAGARPVGSAGQDEQGLTIDAEEQAVGDRPPLRSRAELLSPQQ